MIKNRLVVTAIIVAAFGVGGWYFFTAWGDRTWADPADRELVEIGRAAYAGQCAACHGAELQGQPNWRQRKPDGTLAAPPHDETGHTWHHPDRTLFDITKYGGQRNAPPGFVSAMPPFEAAMSDREIHAVLAYIKTRWPAEIRERQAGINARSR